MLGWCSPVCLCCISEGTKRTLIILFIAPHADVTVLLVCVRACLRACVCVCMVVDTCICMPNVELETQALVQSCGLALTHLRPLATIVAKV